MKQRTKLLINKYLDGTSSNREEQELTILLRDEEPTDTIRALRTMLEDQNEASSNISYPQASVKSFRIGMWIAAAAAVAAIFVMTILQKPRQEQVLQSEVKPMTQMAKPQIREVTKRQGDEAPEIVNPKPSNLQSPISNPRSPSPMPEEATEAIKDNQSYEELTVRLESAKSENNQLREEILKNYDNEHI